ncbi:hypothetical protein L2E82_22980 [Cichorium intybus]|uniref:Uncharacterized protein n=1 Tax=Cichorium intybus TaxID=13427 RepID=A0ACB9DYW5_CICIN|nr:hypothetical protein L2E82_22980 [Cichorium intybus]
MEENQSRLKNKVESKDLRSYLNVKLGNSNPEEQQRFNKDSSIRRENVSFAEVVKGQNHSKLEDDLTINKASLESVEIEKKIERKKIVVLEGEKENLSVDGFMQDGDFKAGQEEGDSLEEEDNLGLSDGESAAGFSEGEFEETYEESIIRESSPEIDCNYYRREKIIKDINDEFRDLTKEHNPPNGQNSPIDGSLCGANKEIGSIPFGRDNSPSPIHLDQIEVNLNEPVEENLKQREPSLKVMGHSSIMQMILRLTTK